MKLLNSKILLIIFVLFSGLGYVISCTRDNESIVPIEIAQPFVPTRGNHVHLPGTDKKEIQRNGNLTKYIQVYYGPVHTLGQPAY